MIYIFFLFFLMICNTATALDGKDNIPEALLASPISGPLEYIPQSFDVISYDADIDLTKAPSRDMSGVCRIWAVWNGAPDIFYFHLRDLKVDSAFYQNIKVDAQAVGDYSSPTYHHEITPPPELSTNSATITIYYSGQMTAEPKVNNSSWGGVHSAQNILYTLGVGMYNNYVSATQHWLPCYDHPSDKAKFHCRFKTRMGLHVASIGKLQFMETDGEGNWIYDWIHNIPCATYLYTFAVSNYWETEFGSFKSPIVCYTFVGDTLKTRQIFKLLPDMVKAFEQRFGKYPFEKVGFVLTPLGSMEHETMISYSLSVFRNSWLNDTINMVAAHELAHQWFGDMVTCRDFRDAWLSESFAAFSECIWMEYLGGFGEYLKHEERKVYNYINIISVDEGALPLYDFPDRDRVSNYPHVIYDKGAVVVGMLRFLLGDEVFFTAINEYLHEYRYGTATTAILKQIFEQESGQDLGWFFDQWVYGKGWPKLDLSYNLQPSEAPDKYKVQLSLKQVQQQDFGTYTNLPVEIGFELKGGDTLYKIVNMTDVEQEFTLDSIPDFNNINFNKGPSVRALLEIVSMAGIAERKSVKKLNLSVYPNPSDSQLIVTFQADGAPVKLRFYDSQSRELFTRDINTLSGLNTYYLDTGNMTDGVYLIMIESHGYYESAKAVVVR